MTLHKIRLRGPWQARVLSSSGAVSPSGQLAPEADVWVCQPAPGDWGSWLGTGFRGTVRYRRAFGRPSGVMPGDRVWLVVEPARELAKVQLNGVFLGELHAGESPLRVEILSHLSARNRLEIDVQFLDLDQPLAGGLVGEVRLEIEPSSCSSS